MELRGSHLAVVGAIIVTVFVSGGGSFIAGELSPIRPERRASATLKALQAKLPSQVRQAGTQESAASQRTSLPEPVICLIIGISLMGASRTIRHRRMRKERTTAQSASNPGNLKRSTRLALHSSPSKSQIGEFAMAQTPDTSYKSIER